MVRDNEDLLGDLPREALANERAFRGYVTNGAYRGVNFSPAVSKLSSRALNDLWTFINHKAEFDMDAQRFDEFNAAFARSHH